MTAVAAPALPRVLVRLKVRLIRNRAKSTKGGRSQLAMSVILGVCVAAGGLIATTALGHANYDRIARAGLVIGATALLLGWAILPLLTFGTDETLDPARLILFPLPIQPLMRGLLMASLVGVAPIAVEVAVAGVPLGFGVSTLVVSVPAVVVLVVLCAVTARTLSTLLASRLTSRRGRDAMIVVGSVLALSLQLLRLVRFSSFDVDSFGAVCDGLRWFPPGMIGQAIVDARDGDIALGLVQLVPAIVAIPLLIRVWARALDRSLTVVTGGATGRRRKAPDTAALPLLFRRLPLPATPWGAVAAKELRYVAREPRRKLLLVNSLLIGLGGPVYFALRSGGDLPPGSVLMATIAGYVGLLNSMNQFGFDGAALWMNVVAGDRTRDTLVGKNVALVVQLLPVMLLSGVVLAAFSGGWAYVPAALLLGMAGLGAGLGVANVVSVRFPIKLPENRSPFSGNGGGQGCAQGLAVVLCMIVLNLLLAPVAIAAGVAAAVAPAALLVVTPLATGYGLLMWHAGLNIAEQRARDGLPEGFIIAVDPTRFRLNARSNR